MATITDPQAILFTNENLRPACDRFMSSWRTLQQLASMYSAKALGPIVAGTTTLQNEFVADGATNADGTKGDGRTQLLGYDVDNAMTQINNLITLVNGQPNILPALTKPSVNSQPIF